MRLEAVRKMRSPCGGGVKRIAREALQGRRMGVAVWLPEATFLFLFLLLNTEKIRVINKIYSLYILVLRIYRSSRVCGQCG